jgi:hypothetical protein
MNRHGRRAVLMMWFRDPHRSVADGAARPGTGDVRARKCGSVFTDEAEASLGTDAKGPIVAAGTEVITQGRYDTCFVTIDLRDQVS